MIDVAIAIDGEAVSVSRTRRAAGVYTDTGDWVDGTATSASIRAAIQPVKGNQLMDMPEVDIATVRVVKTPQSGTPQAPGTLPNATPGNKTDAQNDSNAQGNNGTGKENPATNTPGLPRQTPLPNIGVGGAGIGQGKGQV